MAPVRLANSSYFRPARVRLLPGTPPRIITDSCLRPGVICSSLIAFCPSHSWRSRLPFVWTGIAVAQESNEVLRFSQIRAGMQGYAYTIFAGDQVEKFDLEVIGVLDNFSAPNSPSSWCN